jgi:hypothetical protein
MGHLVVAHLIPYIHMALVTPLRECRLRYLASHGAKSAGYVRGPGDFLWAISSIHSNVHSVRNHLKPNMTGSDMKRLCIYPLNGGCALQTDRGPSTAKLAYWFVSSVVNWSQLMAI